MAGMPRTPDPTATDGNCPDIFTAEFKGSPGHIRVLKPPGGGSSDIFGEGGNAPQPRVVARQHLKSSLFADPPSAPAPAPSTNGNLEVDTNGTHNGTTNGTANGHATSPKGNKNVARNPVTGEGMGDNPLSRSARKREGRNPVTGEGYTGDERDSSHAASAQPKQRVPPGGYTTPLW